MKSLNLFLAFVVCSTVAMASSKTPAPTTPTTSWSDTLKGYGKTTYNYTLGYVDAADAAIVNAVNDYVVNPINNNVVTPYVKPATDKVVEYATFAKNKTVECATAATDFTCEAVAYPFVHPLQSTLAVATVYAMYYAYTQYNAEASKKAKN
jgi:hypothetical protein